LRQPVLGLPPVGCRCEEILRILADECAEVRPDIVNSILIEPALHLGESMPVLLGMLILVAQPRLAPRRLILSIA
jgi:hypothetical protein